MAAEFLALAEGELESWVRPDSVTTTVRVPARSVTQVNVPGLIESDQRGGDAERVVARSETEETGDHKTEFEVETYDIRRWVVTLQDALPHQRTIVVERDKHLFAAGEVARFVLDSRLWPDDVQAMNLKTGRLLIKTHPQVVLSGVSPELLARLPWFGSDNEANVKLVYTGVSNEQQELFKNALNRWFLLYTANVMGQAQSLSGNERPDAVIIEFIIEKAGEGATSPGRIEYFGDDRIVITGADAESLHTALGEFLAQMDKAYPYYGHMYVEDPVFERAGLQGRVLEPEMESDYILSPTLWERWERYFLPSLPGN